LRLQRDEPLWKGFMRNGHFAWPSAKNVCPGYTEIEIGTGKELRKIACGVVFESTVGNVERCRECRKQHSKHWHRKNKVKVLRKNVSR
jgi:hypothetical protein